MSLFPCSVCSAFRTPNATDDDASASRESSSGAFYTLVPYDRVGDVDADP